MQFTSPLMRGTLLKRYKRFFADILLDSGEEITAHCPNTGAMTGCAEPGFTAWVSPSDNPKRKLKFTWELAVTPENHWIGINTHHANKLVQEALTEQRFAPFNHITAIKREVTAPGSNSRFDFCLTQQDGTPLYVEVKSVTLADGEQGYFPDTVTTRGQKHAEELGRLAEQGIATCLFFCVQHTGIQRVQPAAHIDPKYAEAVRLACSKDVRLFAASSQICQEKIHLNQQLPINLQKKS